MRREILPRSAAQIAACAPGTCVNHEYRFAPALRSGGRPARRTPAGPPAAGPRAGPRGPPAALVLLQPQT